MAGKNQKSSRRAAIREQRTKQQKREKTILISVVSVFALAIAAILIIPNLPVSPDRINRPEAIQRPLIDGNAIGDPNAPVKIEEFSDFKCIHCKTFWEESEGRLIADYVATNKVYFRYVPMSFLAPDSVTAAEAAYCAMDQGKFWEYHDYVFANFGTELTDPMLRAFARDLELDMGEFDRCYNGKKYSQQVRQDAQYASSKGVTGTPTFDVNGQLIDRFALFDLIEEKLAQP